MAIASASPRSSIFSMAESRRDERDARYGRDHWRSGSVMSVPAVSVARTLRAAGRQPSLPFCVDLADGRELTCAACCASCPASGWSARPNSTAAGCSPSCSSGGAAPKALAAGSGGLEALRLAGVPTPELVVATAMAGGGYALADRFSRTRREPRRSLGTALSGEPPGDAEALAVLAPALGMLGRLHAAGLVQDDLHLGNFLRHDGQMFVVDGDAVRVISRGQPLRRRTPAPTWRCCWRSCRPPGMGSCRLAAGLWRRAGVLARAGGHCAAQYRACQSLAPGRLSGQDGSRVHAVRGRAHGSPLQRRASRGSRSAGARCWRRQISAIGAARCSRTAAPARSRASS
jgi:hypothetical protein